MDRPADQVLGVASSGGHGTVDELPGCVGSPSELFVVPGNEGEPLVSVEPPEGVVGELGAAVVSSLVLSMSVLRLPLPVPVTMLIAWGVCSTCAPMDQ